MSRVDSMGSAGFSLIETLVAMVLTSVTVMALGPVMFQAAHRQVVEAGTVERNSVLLGEATRLASLPVGDIAARAGCTTLPALAQDTHELCVTLQALGGGQTRLTVVVTPGNSAIPPDSVVLVRLTAPQGNPFNTAGSP